VRSHRPPIGPSEDKPIRERAALSREGISS
jgi:hypothetical protein